MRSLLIACFFTLTLFALFPFAAQAKSEIQLDLASTYVVEENTVQVEHKLTLTNTDPVTYAKQYAFQTTSTELQNITVSIDGEAITPHVVPLDSMTSIAFNFAEPLVGQGKKHDVVISYTDPHLNSFSQQTGYILIPPLQNRNDYHSYQVSIITPSPYGLPARTFPDPTSVNQTGTQVVSTFDTIGSDGIVAQFGDRTTLAFELEYQLANTTDGVATIQVTLPPDTLYQRVNYQELDPKPLNLVTDKTGNWIATYQVPARADLTARVNGQAYLSTQPQAFTTQPQHEAPALSASSSQPLSIIEAMISSLRSSENSVDEYSLVSQFTQQLRDKGDSVKVLVGLSSEQVGSTAPQRNWWIERLESSTNQWQPLNPTLAISSKSPASLMITPLHQVTIGIDQTPIQLATISGSIRELPETPSPAPAPLSIEVKTKSLVGIPIPGWYEAVITNPTGQARYELALEWSANQDQVWSTQTQVESLLPWQSEHIQFFVSSSSWAWSKSSLQLQVDDQNAKFTITAGSPLVFAVGAGVIILALVAGSLLVFRHRRTRPLRR